MLNTFLTELNLKGLVLTGGEDIGKNKNRDQTEVNLLNWALKNSLPILGICRGMQLIAKYKKVKLERSFWPLKILFAINVELYLKKNPMSVIIVEVNWW